MADREQTARSDEPERFSAKAIVFVAAVIAVVLLTIVLVLVQYHHWVTRDIREQRNSVEPSRMTELEAVKEGILAGEGVVEVEEPGRTRRVQPLAIEAAFDLLRRHPESYGVHEAE